MQVNIPSCKNEFTDKQDILVRRCGKYHMSYIEPLPVPEVSQISNCPQNPCPSSLLDPLGLIIIAWEILHISHLLQVFCKTLVFYLSTLIDLYFICPWCVVTDIFCLYLLESLNCIITKWFFF